MYKSKIKIILFCSACLAFMMSPVYADEACDAEVVAIQAVLDAPSSEISDANIEQSTILFNMLSEQCSSGAALSDNTILSQQIRVLLGMGDALNSSNGADILTVE